MIKRLLLPKEYQQVEWIASDGNQIIDTGYGNSHGVTYKFKYMPLRVMLQIIVGCQDSSSFHNRNIVVLQQTGQIYIGVGDTNKFTGFTYSANNIYEVEATTIPNKIRYTQNGGTPYTDSVTTTITDFNIYIFAGNTDGSNFYQSSARMYYMKIYDENDVLVRDLVPCFRKSDNVIGMYDTVNNVFYTNSGTGVFTKGNNITPTITSIYKGEEKIVAIYHGTDLVFR